MSAKRRKYFVGSRDKCHLCLLPIPSNVTSTHALYGTIDHILPLSLGGRDHSSNRAPAHRYCNSIRGNILLDKLTVKLKLRMINEALSKLKRIGTIITKKKRAEVRVAAGWVEPPAKVRTPGKDLARWEDDGGAVSLTPVWHC